MIHSLTFKKIADCDIKTDDISHVFTLKELEGKTFNFKPGLNLIVGRNGSGKSSLLQTIRNIWWCESFKTPSFYSSFLFQMGASLIHHSENGWYKLTEMVADYSRPMFNMRRTADIQHGSIQDSVLNMAQFYDSAHQSKGEETMQAISMMVKMITGQHIECKDKDFFNFTASIDRLKKYLSIHDVDTIVESGQEMIDYFSRNNKCEEELSKCLTVTMDEPDANLDVEFLKSVKSFLETVHREKRDQFLVVSHNVALIKHFLEDDTVNFIELSKGYLDEVASF